MDELLKQAKKKALSLLTDMDRTETQLRERLKQKGYPEPIIEEVMSYVQSFGYVNDVNYARRFVDGKKSQKSRYEIMGMLLNKGIDRELAENALDECYSSEDEYRTLQRLIEKQHFCIEDSTEEEKKKLCARFLRKGFRYEDVQKIIEVSYGNA